jgi:pre-rRNA-processing protein TSR3
MAKNGNFKIVYHLNQIPRGSIVLNPYADKAVSREDLNIIKQKGITGIECSLKKIKKS